MSNSEPSGGRGLLGSLRRAIGDIRANAPWAFRPAFVTWSIAALVAACVAGIAIGYVATKAAVPYFIRLGVVEPAMHTVRAWLGVREPIRWVRHWTHFGDVQTASIPITYAGERFPASVEDLDGNLLVMTMGGEFFYMTPSYELHSLDMKLPMNVEGLGELATRPNFNMEFFRSHDLLAVPVAPHTFDLYASYDRFTGSCFEIVVTQRRVTVTDSGIEPGADWEDLYVAHPCLPPQTDAYVFGGHQASGRLALLNPNTLLLSIGDVEQDGAGQRHDGPQDPNWDFGKITTISLPSGRAEHLAMGFRNPEGMVVDSEGRIWESEHGPAGGDEVNLVQRGANYGWPLVTYGAPYNERLASPHTHYGQHDGYTRPAYVFTPAIGPSQLIEPSADTFPMWRSCLILSTLRGQAIYVLRIDDGQIRYAESVPIGVRIRDILARPNGEIAMVSEVRAGGGSLILMRPGSGAAPFEFTDLRAPRTQMAQPAATPEARGRQLFQTACNSCHSVRGRARPGPPLNGVVGREVGSVDGFGYSEAMGGARGSWTPDRLRAFLDNPGHELPGTSMPDPEISNDQAEDLVAYLRTAE